MEKQNSFRACSAEQVVATHNNSPAMAKGGAINTILEMDWPSSDEDDEDFEDDSDADAADAPGDTDAAAAGADEGPRRKSRRVCMPSFYCSLCTTVWVGGMPRCLVLTCMMREGMCMCVALRLQESGCEFVLLRA